MDVPSGFPTSFPELRGISTQFVPISFKTSPGLPKLSTVAPDLASVLSHSVRFHPALSHPTWSHLAGSPIVIFVEGPLSMIRSALCLAKLFDPPWCPIMISVARSLLVTPYLLGSVVRSFETPCLCRGSLYDTQENQRTKNEASGNFDFRSFHCFLRNAKFVSSWPLVP